MGICVGLDFGTTYTTMSYIDEDGPKAINFGSRKLPIYDVPTVLAVNRFDDSVIEIGRNAIKRVLSEEYNIYRGFKMLLAEKNERVLKGKGFTQDFTPEMATEMFLSKLFEEAQAKIHDDIDKIIVGVPFVWTSQNNDGFVVNDKKKQIVTELLKKTSHAKEVEFRAEPELAAGYFADKLRREEGKPFLGHILVIDYGGGTLDVTLCRATVEPDGTSRLEPIGSGWGAGENHDENGLIGNAGLRFMESVADLTLERNGVPHEEIQRNHNDDGEELSNSDELKKAYVAFVSEIEEGIISSAEIPDKIMKKQYRDSRFDEYRQNISDVYASYRGKSYFVQFGTLVEAYEICKAELEGVLKDVKEWIDSENNSYQAKNQDDMCIQYEDSISDSFKVATIGGFCNFKLTQRQITEEIPWLERVGYTDSRYEAMDEDDRAVAVSYGAALLANELLRIPHKFPYSLYVYGEKGENVVWDQNGDPHYNRVPDYDLAFRFFEENDIYIPGEPVFLKTKRGEKKQHVLADKIPFIQRTRGKEKSVPVKPSIEMSLPDNGHNRVYLAIAMEKNENLTLYIYDKTAYDELTDEEKSVPNNGALIGVPQKYPDIYALMGHLVE
jgi:hypothetical protein